MRMPLSELADAEYVNPVKQLQDRVEILEKALQSIKKCQTLNSAKIKAKQALEKGKQI